MTWRFFLFRTTLLSDIRFDDLRNSFSRKVGMRFLKGNIQTDFVSLFYIFDGHFYRKMKMQRIPTMQFTIDKHDTKNGKQIIRFKLADFASVLMIVVIILINILVRTTIPIEPKYGVIISVFIYIYSLGIYNQQLGQFKEELKLIQKELNDKNEN